MKPQDSDLATGVRLDLRRLPRAGGGRLPPRRPAQHLGPGRALRPGIEHRVLVVADRDRGGDADRTAAVVGDGGATVAELVERVNRDRTAATRAAAHR